MRYRKIPDETIRRLPFNLREVQLFADKCRSSIQSSEFANNLGVNSVQVRKDLSFFDGLGTPGVGYDIKKLFCEL